MLLIRSVTLTCNAEGYLLLIRHVHTCVAQVHALKRTKIATKRSFQAGVLRKSTKKMAALLILLLKYMKVHKCAIYMCIFNAQLLAQQAAVSFTLLYFAQQYFESSAALLSAYCTAAPLFGALSLRLLYSSFTQVR